MLSVRPKPWPALWGSSSAPLALAGATSNSSACKCREGERAGAQQRAAAQAGGSPPAPASRPCRRASHRVRGAVGGLCGGLPAAARVGAAGCASTPPGRCCGSSGAAGASKGRRLSINGQLLFSGELGCAVQQGPGRRGGWPVGGGWVSSRRMGTPGAARCPAPHSPWPRRPAPNQQQRQQPHRSVGTTSANVGRSAGACAQQRCIRSR